MSWNPLPDADDHVTRPENAEALPTAPAPAPAPMASEVFDEEEVFEDAKDELLDNKIETVDLHQSFVDCEVALKMFFNNDIDGAMEIMKPWASTSLYHSLGAAIFEFIPAMLTFEPAQIQQALAAIKRCINICNQKRKRYTFVESIGCILKKTNFSAFTDEEAHAELCYAEALLLQAALTIIEGEDLAGLIKGTFKVKTCYNTYQDCWDIKEQKVWDTEESKFHFKSGVRLGTATFNLMISLLPPKIVTLLEFVGFSGNKYYGLSELEKGSRNPGIRAVLCDLTLLAYHLVICQFTGGDGDMQMSLKILTKSLEEYPNSVWFLVFKARYQLLQGLFDKAIATYERAIQSQNTFKQFRQLCYWELMWAYGLKLEFRQSAFYAEKLLDGSTWSRTTHSYIKAAMLLQTGEDIKQSEVVMANDLLRHAAMYKSRIAGKSLPMEKFVIKRCTRYQTQRCRLILPALELLCLWNMFPILTKNKSVLHTILTIIERTSHVVESTPLEWMSGYEADNKALLLFLHGSCYSALGMSLLAIDKLQQVYSYKKDIKEDSFLLPYTTFEIAVCYFQLGQLENSLIMLNEAKKKYSGYSLESRLHFRIHAKMEIVKNRIGKTKIH